VQSAKTLATLLGLKADDPFAALDRLSVGAEPEFQAEMGGVLRWKGASDGVWTDAPAMDDLARRVAGDHSADLAGCRHAQRTDAACAPGSGRQFHGRARGRRGARRESANAKHGSRPIGVGGGVFGNARFNTELTRLMGSSVSWSPVPEAAGRALGAAASTAAGAVAGLALGPAFSEEEIKRTLDNCRLDYVYEPDWARLLTRVSRMLAQGKVVGWFQGPMTFGPRTLGSRSILGDPSSPYARQNLNEYLRNLPLDEPLPVVFAPSQADRCVPMGASPQRGIRDAEVSPEWRRPLAAALDWRQSVRVHGLSPAQSPRLADLLELHYAATGTPGLIEANLAGPGEPVACSPRDAVRTVYSSAIDALVIGRFLLMKDYWLLRTQDR
jgi:predicted NodU family carbamoyl transferase